MENSIDIKVPSIITDKALKACFNKIYPDKEFNQEDLSELLTWMTPQELLLTLVDVLNDLAGGAKTFQVHGRNIPVQAFVLEAWLKLRGYAFPDYEVETYSTAYLCNTFDELDISDEAIGNAVSEGYIMERKMVYG